MKIAIQIFQERVVKGKSKRAVVQLATHLSTTSIEDKLGKIRQLRK